jgi:hypothetical protein
MWQSVKALFFKPGFILLVYIVAAIFISIQLISLGTHLFVIPDLSKAPNDILNQMSLYKLFIGQHHTEYNNYIIFKYSWFHLIHDKNLYTLYPTEHWDYYKYSPTFSLFMGLFAYLPDYIGLSLWNLLNALALFYAIRMLPFNNRTQCLLLWFIANELLTSLSNTQSNGLMCGLMIAAYACMQRRQLLLATLWIVAATFIKVYGAIGFCLFLFYPDKFKFILYAAMWTIIFAILPLTVTSFHTLAWQYQNWLALMKADAVAAIGISVSGWLHSWFGLNSGYLYITLIGIILFLLPFARIRMYKDEVFKLLILASMLIWVIIFNHKAESPTYIIAVTGAGIWYFASPRATWRTAVLLFVLIFTSLSSTDLFPPYIKTHFIKPYSVKAVPCILTWCIIFIDLMRIKLTRQDALPKSFSLAE